jgi:biotin carboxyl carrier protein
MIKVNQQPVDIRNVSVRTNQIDLNYESNYYTVYYSYNSSGGISISSGAFVHYMRKKPIELPRKKTSARDGSPQSNNGVASVRSPLHGKLIQLNVVSDCEVVKGDLLAVIESMKMENNIVAPINGVIKSIHATVNEYIEKDQIIAYVNPLGEGSH